MARPHPELTHARDLLFVGVLVALPFVVPAAVILARRPLIHFADDRAMIELAVGNASRGHQLIGNGTRFGWSDLGPAVFYLLSPLYRLFGGSAFAIPVGLLLLYGATSVGTVALFVRRRRPVVGYGAAVGILAYARAFGFGHFTNVWAPWEVILPLLLLVALGAVAAAEDDAAWALAAATALGSVMIQTKIEMVVIVPILLATALVLRTTRFGLPIVGRDRKAWRRPLALVFLATTVLLWLPPLWQQVTGSPGNLSQVASFTIRGATGRGPAGLQHGHSFGEGLSALGEELSVFPLGHAGVVSPGFEHRLARTPAWAIALSCAYFAFTAAVVLISTRLRRDALAASLSTMTLSAMLATVLWTMHIQGPVSFFLVVWASILPLGTWMSVLLLLTGDEGHPLAGGLPFERGLTLTFMVLLVVLSVGLVARHAGTFEYNTDRSSQIATLDALIDRSGLVHGTTVRVHIATAPSWPVATGVVLDLMKSGAHVGVDPNWVGYFGPRFLLRNQRVTADLWFDQPGVRAPSSAPATATRLGVTNDIVLSWQPAISG